MVGSFRDSLSVLDQLIGSSADNQVSYASAIALLGYTPESLLDEVVDAVAAHDGAGVFQVIDKVIESGQDPRRFAEDLLRRLRDLVIVQAVPDAAERGLIEAPPELAARLGQQAARLGTAEATRAAEVVNTGLTAMRGATAPRLLLELICARLLLPAVDDDVLGVAARLDRVERRLGGADAIAPRRRCPAGHRGRAARSGHPDRCSAEGRSDRAEVEAAQGRAATPKVEPAPPRIEAARDATPAPAPAPERARASAPEPKPETPPPAVAPSAAPKAAADWPESPSRAAPSAAAVRQFAGRASGRVRGARGGRRDSSTARPGWRRFGGCGRTCWKRSRRASGWPG